MDNELEPLYLKKLIQKLKIKKMIVKWKKMAKKSRHRKFVLKEFCSSQKFYIDCLKKLKNEFQIPLHSLSILSEQDFEFVFNNLDSIISLAEQMYRRVEDLQKSWDPIQTIMSEPLNYLQKFFKIYKEYCKNYIKSSEIILSILEKQKVNQLSNPFKPNSIIDYLVKPTQRPFKYPLLIRQYLHDLPKDHKDFVNLEKTKKIYERLCDELNESMESQIRMKKMIELEKIFGDDIFESSRQLKTEFTAYYVDIHCKVFVFNNVLMIAKIGYNNKLESYKKIFLNGGSYVMKKENTKNFINRLFICGIYLNIHLIFNNLHQRNSAFQVLDNIINSLYQQEYNRLQMISKVKIQRETIMMNESMSNLCKKYEWVEQKYYEMKLKVWVVGAEQRLNKEQEKVVYFVKFQLTRPQQIYQLITVDIEKLKQIESYLYQLYPQIQLPSLDLKNKSIFYDDFKNDFTKFVEFRSMHIETFLNHILRMKQVSKRPQFVLQKLNVHEFIWLYLNKPQGSDCGCESCLRMDIITGMDAYRKQLKEHERNTSPYCISKAIHIQNSITNSIEESLIQKENLEYQMLWAFSKMNRINFSLTYRQSYGKKMSFHVYVPSFIEQVKIKISNATINDTARDIINEVCRRKGLETTRDLVLVISSSKQEYILDDDEYLWNFSSFIKLQKEESSSSSRGSFFQNFSKTFDDWGINEKDEYRLTLRKLYVFDKKMQEESCEKNLERYQLVLGELLIRFKTNFLTLSINDIRVFCALFYGIEEYNSLIYSKKIVFNEQKLKNYLPKNKWNFIGDEFASSIKNIIENEVEKWDRVTFLYRCVIRNFGDKAGWRNTYFEVENLQPQSLQGGHRILLMGINQKEVIVGPRNSSAILLSFKLSELAYRVSGQSIFLDTENRVYEFKGKNLHFFQKLFGTYSILQKIN